MRRRALLLAGLIGFVWLWYNPTPAPALPPSAPTSLYGAWGNLTNGDCEYAADANAVRFHDPTSTITTGEVLHAWRHYGESDSLYFMVTTGFDGQRLSLYTPVSKWRSIRDLETSIKDGGVLADGDAGLLSDHEVFVLAAKANRVTLVSWGRLYTLPFATYRADVEVQWALTWAAS